MSISKPIEPLNNQSSDVTSPNNITLKSNPDGSDNVNYVDLLDEDKPMAGQKFACLSFISPEHVLKQKDLFLFEQFIREKHWK